MSMPILPGATLGLIGGGQLGRMFALNARRMGYRVHTFDPSHDSPTGQISDREFTASFDDLRALGEFTQSVDIITYEFENIPLETLLQAQSQRPCYPDPQILHTTQNREREKNFLSRHGFPTVPYRIVQDLSSLQSAIDELGTPAVLKTCDFGYDGKGQQKISSTSDLASIWKHHAASQGIVEAWIDDASEFSVIIARNFEGQTRSFPITENIHHHHILSRSLCPSGLPMPIQEQALEIAADLTHQFGLIGLIAVEFFLTPQGELLINEIAPRPHNSGHYSFDACLTNQFEQQLRAVCGLPLGDTRLLPPAALMTNLLGDLWQAQSPPWPMLLQIPNLKLHLYGKTDPRPRRKMGHYTIIAQDVSQAIAQDNQARGILGLVQYPQ
jgi:5-(carboxyamino)imidazole ribonucleotide synthase